MSRLEEINDVKTLQQVASHLEKSTVRLSKENAHLRAQVARLKGLDVDPQMELELLKEQLAAMQRMVFSESSKRVSGRPGQLPARVPHRSGLAEFPHPAPQAHGFAA